MNGVFRILAPKVIRIFQIHSLSEVGDVNEELLARTTEINTNFAVSHSFSSEVCRYAELSVADNELAPRPNQRLFPGTMCGHLYEQRCVMLVPDQRSR